MAGSGIPFRELSQSTPIDVGAALSARHILQDIDHVFGADLDEKNVAGIGVLARVASALLDGSLDSYGLDKALGSGQWKVALDISTQAARLALANPEHILAASIAMLHVPSCLVDLFTVAVKGTVNIETEGASLASYSTASFVLPETFRAIASFVKKHPTRSGLMRLAAFGSINWLAHPTLYQFGLSSDSNRKRFTRYAKFLNYIAENPSLYSAVLKSVMQERWAEANDLASQHLSAIGLHGGETVVDPPFLADFLVLALTSWTDPLEIATKIKSEN